MADNTSLPAAFAAEAAGRIDDLLAHQQTDGSIIYDPAAAPAWQQHVMLALAFCYAGLGPDASQRQSPRLRQAILKMGDFFHQHFDERGCYHYLSHGYDISGVDQHMTYAWVQTLALMRQMNEDIPYDAWSDKILRACQTLIDHRLRKLVGVRRFMARVMGTSTNHVAFYVSTIYRCGQVLGRQDLCDFVLPIGRALAADIHSDGYWEEHGDLLRSGGPTPGYNYLTHCAVAQMYQFTREDVFLAALAKSTAFHSRFSYPDASPIDLIDERVRYDPQPRMWGLFGFSHWDVGRGMARNMFQAWQAHNRKGSLAASVPNATALPQTLARLCENAMYWNSGPELPPPFAAADHRAALALPAAVFRRGAWFVALSALPATNSFDPAYRTNPFALDRQKLFSVWHEKTGLIIDGSHSKYQCDYSTFWADAEHAKDFCPCGGAVGEEDGDLIARAAYKTFYAQVRLRPLSDSSLQIELSVDAAGNRGPFLAGFTLWRLAGQITDSRGQSHALGLEPLNLSGGFAYGPVRLSGPDDLRLRWPISPFNSYAADGKSPPAASQLRVELELTPQRPHAVVTLTVL